MWPFSKKTECKEGAVCAWEFDGKLYKTKLERDRAETAHRKETVRSGIVDYLEKKLIDNHNIDCRHYNYADWHDYIGKHMKDKVTRKQIEVLADLIIVHWREISYTLEKIKERVG